MNFISASSWSLGVFSHRLGQRQVLDLLAGGLRQVYAEPECEPLPDRLRELVAKLEEAESESLHASSR
jgi:hypothetical protein